MALALAAAGAAVAVVARSKDQVEETAALMERAGGRGAVFPVDVTDQGAVESMVGDVERRLGAVDLLVNGAGIPGPIGPLWETDPREWWRALEVNLRGTMLPAWAVLRRMIPRRGGRIVNLASGAGGRPEPYASSYACAKAAVLRFTDSLAAAAREYGISVFAISPGMVRTALTHAFADSAEGRRWLGLHAAPPDAWFPPERAADLVLFLASGRADALSGRFFHVTDDVPMLVDKAEEIQTEDRYALRLRK